MCVLECSKTQVDKVLRFSPSHLCVGMFENTSEQSVAFLSVALCVGMFKNTSKQSVAFLSVAFVCWNVQKHK